MSLNLSMLEGSLNPKNIFKTIKHNIKFAREHPDYFDPDGLLVFVVLKVLEKLCLLFNMLESCALSILAQFFVLTVKSITFQHTQL